MSHYWFSYSFPVTDRYRKSVQKKHGRGWEGAVGVEGVATGQKAQGNDTEHSPNHAVKQTNPAPILRPPAQYWRRLSCLIDHVYTRNLT
jgi:hypothetical protein